MSRVRRSAAVLTLVSLSALCSGCQSWHNDTGIWSWRGKGYNDDDLNHLTQNLRPPGDERQFSGVDAKARDIERSLGVR
jgi:hypothetical protein